MRYDIAVSNKILKKLIMNEDIKLKGTLQDVSKAVSNADA